jgi:hypothetical protein
MDFCNKVQCLSLESFFSLVQCLWVRPGAYPRVEHLKGASLRYVPPACKHWTRLEKLARDKHSSFLRISVNYCHNKFYSAAPGVFVPWQAFLA